MGVHRSAGVYFQPINKLTQSLVIAGKINLLRAAFGGKMFDASSELAQGVLDSDEGVVAVTVAAILTAERWLLGVVLFITWHDTR